MDKPSSIADQRRLLAELLQHQRAAGPDLVPRARDGRIPLSYAQLRLWLLDQLEPASSIYTISTVLRLSGPLRVDVLDASLQEIVRRHEALRTVFLHEAGQPYQVVQPFRPVPLPVIDLGARGELADEAVAAELARAGAQQPFDLRTGPLLRVALLRKTDHEHLLSLDLHHIVSDAWSFKLFTQELATLYAELSRGQPCSLPPLVVQYPDYCLWERQWLGAALVDEQLAYWKTQLAGPLPVVRLPTDRPRQPKQTYRGALHRFYLPRPLVEGLKRFSQQAGVTPFMTLLATFQTLIYRYTGQEDLLVGSAFAGRNRREVHALIGFFVNTLPLRVSLSGAPSFTALLRRVREAALGAYAHQDIPFVKLVEALQPDRDTSYAPLVQTMFVLRQKAPAATYPAGELTIGRPRELDGGVAKFELSWSMEEEDDDFLAQIEYNADLFDAARIERLAGHFVTLLGAAIREPARPITTLPLLTEPEQQELLHAWNPAPGTPPGPCFHRIFEAQVARAPDQVAVVLDDARLTYAELDAQASRLARQLRARGVGPGVLVGLCLERSFALISSILAIFKAGGAYVPIDPGLPQERIALLLEDARLELVLVHPQTRALLEAKAGSIAIVDADDVRATEAELPEEGEDGRRLAYVIYTSGSTGRPKGVQVEHAGLQNMLEAQIATFGVQRSSRVLQFASVSFDASIFEIVMALGAGATLVLAPRLTVGAPLVELLAHQAITHATLPPSVLANLPDATLPALETIITAGEACPPAVVERWAGSHALFNAYGPTEATVWSTVARCEVGKRVTIGQPIGGTQIYLLDAQRQLVPAGVPGELYIGGIGLARGYLHREELTRQRFVESPFDPGARLYRTGDLARHLDDGSIDFLGRADDQVKLRGFRIELEEVELALLQHPQVREAVVLVKGDGLENQQLVAFHVGGSPAPSAAELRAFLKQKLPSYMVPSVFVELAAFPLTPSNKVDRQALVAPELAPFDPEVYAAPTTAIEEITANLWAAVLRRERVGIHDNFFELGGHSLQATQVIARLGEAFAQPLPLVALFERPTVAELARFIQERRQDEQPVRAAPMPRVPAAESYALSFAQHRLWALDSVAPGQADYNIPTVLELRGRLEVAAFCGCLRAVVARHEALRTRLVTVDGAPRQVITECALECPIVELSGLSPEPQGREVQRLALVEAQRPFDLANDLPVRARLLRLGPEHHVLLLTIHHIAADDRSMRILLGDLHALYAAAMQGVAPELPPLPVQYKDFAAWQRQCMTEELLEQQLAYWRRQLADLPQSTTIPSDHPPAAPHARAGDSAAHLLPAALVEALARLGRQESSTLFMTALAGFAAVLHRYTRQDDVVLGTPVANRSRGELEQVVGYCGNTLVLRTDVSGHPSFRTLLSRVRKLALEAYEHADVPFEAVVDRLGLARGQGHAPLLRILFAFQDTAPPPPRIGDVALSVSETDNKTAKCDLVIFLRLEDDGIAVRVQYRADLFEPATIERLLAHFHRVLEAAAGDPDLPVDAIPLVSDDEWQQLVSLGTASSVAPPHARVDALFEAQAQRTPEALAVVWNDRRLTYLQLNQRANQLALHLRRMGIAHETPVGLYLERSLELVVGILGVLKAGGVYVPLDPAYPPARIAHMIADARVAVLLTRGGLAAGLPPHDARVLDLEAAALGEEPAGDLALRGHGEDLACVLYTSGSTGGPKGVAIPHRAINRLVLGTNYVDLGPGDRIAQASNASFDAALFEIWGALLNGAQLVGVDKEVALSPHELVHHLQAHGITVLFLTTALFNLVATQVPAGLRTVGSVLVGGEAMDARCAREVLVHGAPGRLLNVYGPTENTTFTTWQRVDEVPEGATRIPIGGPISGTQVLLLDARLQPVPIGVPGELYIGGAGLARGYLHRPELTDERFIRDPFSAEPGARLYKTGDLARYRPDGRLEFLERLDHQVKVRGFRIELGEIEAALRSHASVADAVVLVHEEPSGHKRLAAYVVAAAGQVVQAGELRQALSGQLPSFMVPSAFVALDAMPLSPNGKVDRKRLAQAQDLVPERELAYVAPRSELEREVAAVWQDVLGVAKVGVHDNFFDLGGSSLLVPQVMSRLGALLGRKLAAVTLYQYPNISALAAFLGQGAVPGSSFTSTEQTVQAMRESRSRQGQRRRKLVR